MCRFISNIYNIILPWSSSSLVYTGANINAQDHTGLTALWQASRAGHLQAAQLLVSAGARIEKGSPALCGAAQGGHLNIIRWLLSKGKVLVG